MTLSSTFLFRIIGKGPESHGVAPRSQQPAYEVRLNPVDSISNLVAGSNHHEVFRRPASIVRWIDQPRRAEASRDEEAERAVFCDLDAA
jgi:hypothetical protein